MSGCQFDVRRSGAFSAKIGALNRAALFNATSPCLVCLKPGIPFIDHRWRLEKLQNKIEGVHFLYSD